MTDRNFDIDRRELDAYADGAMKDPARRARVERWLDRHPEMAREIAQDRRNIDRIASALDPVLHEPVPARLTAAVDQAGGAAREPRWFRTGAIAASLILAFWLGGMFAGDNAADPDSDTPPADSQQIAEAQTPDTPAPDTPAPETSAAVDEARAERVAAQMAELNALTRPLTQPVAQPMAQATPGGGAQLLGQQADIPNLSRFGLVPVSTDRLGGDGREMRRVVYNDHLGTRIELTATRSLDGADRVFQVEEKAGKSVIYWQSGATAYRLEGDVPASRLKEYAASMPADPVPNGGVPSVAGLEEINGTEPPAAVQDKTVTEDGRIVPVRPDNFRSWEN